MNDKLQPSITSRETPASELSRSSSESGATTGCCELFLSCFKVRRKKAPVEDTVNNNGKDFDYVVEKLIVQRVPFVFVAMQGKSETSRNNSARESCNSSREINSTKAMNNSSKGASNFQQSLGNAMKCSTSETQSLLYYSDRLNHNMIPLDVSDKWLHHDINIAKTKEKNKEHTMTDDYHIRLTQLMEAMSSLHPDLKEHERPPKDPEPLIMKRNKSSRTKISVKKLLNRHKEDPKQKTFKSQTSLEESFSRKKEFGIINSSEMKKENEPNVLRINQLQHDVLDDFQDNYASTNESIVHSIQDVFCNDKDHVKSFVETNQINLEVGKKINNELQCNHLSFINESKSVSEITANTDSLNTTLRWKIVLKRYKSKTLKCSEVSQEMRKYFNTSQ